MKSDLEAIKLVQKAMREMGYSAMAQAYAYQKLGRAANEILGMPRMGRWLRFRVWLAALAKRLTGA